MLPIPAAVPALSPRGRGRRESPPWRERGNVSSIYLAVGGHASSLCRAAAGWVLRQERPKETHPGPSTRLRTTPPERGSAPPVLPLPGRAAILAAVFSFAGWKPALPGREARTPGAVLQRSQNSQKLSPRRNETSRAAAVKRRPTARRRCVSENCTSVRPGRSPGSSVPCRNSGEVVTKTWGMAL